MAGRTVTGRSDGRLSRTASLKDLAAAEIRSQIFSGELRPGSKIDQDEIAEELGTSKLPIREALITLDSEGLVRNLPRRGSFVAALTRDDITDHFEIFGEVVGIAAARAALHLSDEEVAELGALLDELESATDPEDQERLNYAFHRAINVAGRSRRLTSVLALLGKALPSGFYEQHAEWSDRANDDHRAILDAIDARQPDDAAAAMSQHLRGSAEYAVKALDAIGFWDDTPD